MFGAPTSSYVMTSMCMCVCVCWSLADDCGSKVDSVLHHQRTIRDNSTMLDAVAGSTRSNDAWIGFENGWDLHDNTLMLCPHDITPHRFRFQAIKTVQYMWIKCYQRTIILPYQVLQNFYPSCIMWNREEKFHYLKSDAKFINSGSI